MKLRGRLIPESDKRRVQLKAICLHICICTNMAQGMFGCSTFYFGGSVASEYASCNGASNEDPRERFPFKLIPRCERERIRYVGLGQRVPQARIELCLEWCFQNACFWDENYHKIGKLVMLIELKNEVKSTFGLH